MAETKGTGALPMPHLRSTLTPSSETIFSFQPLLFFPSPYFPSFPLFLFFSIRLECSLFFEGPSDPNATPSAFFCTPSNGSIFFSLHFLHFCDIFFGNGRTSGERG